MSAYYKSIYIFSGRLPASKTGWKVNTDIKPFPPRKAISPLRKSISPPRKAVSPPRKAISPVLPKPPSKSQSHPKRPMRRVNTVPRTDHYKMAYDQQIRDIEGRLGNGKMSVYHHDDWYYEGPQSKVGSLDNIDHIPKQSTVKIESRKFNWGQRAAAKIGSLDNYYHQPGGGTGKIFERPTYWPAASKVGSLDYIDHVPGGGDRRIEQRKVSWNVQSKVGSLDNIDHKPQSNVLPLKDKVQRLNWNAQSKVGSLDNYNHEPGGGKGQIFNERLSWTNAPRIDAKNPEFEKKKQERKQLDELPKKKGPVIGRYHAPLPPIRRHLGGSYDNETWTRGPKQEQFDRLER